VGKFETPPQQRAQSDDSVASVQAIDDIPRWRISLLWIHRFSGYRTFQFETATSISAYHGAAVQLCPWTAVLTDAAGPDKPKCRSRDGAKIGCRFFRLNPLEPLNVDFGEPRKLRSPAPLPKF